MHKQKKRKPQILLAIHIHINKYNHYENEDASQISLQTLHKG